MTGRSGFDCRHGWNLLSSLLLSSGWNSYSVDTGVPLLGSKAAGAWSWPFTSNECRRLRMSAICDVKWTLTCKWDTPNVSTKIRGISRDPRSNRDWNADPLDSSNHLVSSEQSQDLRNGAAPFPTFRRRCLLCNRREPRNQGPASCHRRTNFHLDRYNDVTVAITRSC